MQYLLLIYSVDPTIWFALSEEEREGLTPAHLEFGEQLARSGELVSSAALSHPARSKTVRRHDGEPVVTDGPFAEAKEHLTGFYLLDCESEERAIEIAAQAPDAGFTRVELRPCMDLTAGLEM
jgi:hypothetical protein